MAFLPLSGRLPKICGPTPVHLCGDNKKYNQYSKINKNDVIST